MHTINDACVNGIQQLYDNDEQRLRLRRLKQKQLKYSRLSRHLNLFHINVLNKLKNLCQCRHTWKIII